MKKLYILFAIIAVLTGIPAAQAQTQQTLRVLGEQEKTCLAKQDIYRLQVPIIGCTPSDTVCCSDDGIYTIGLKGAPSYIATMVRFGIIVVITIMFLMLIVAGVQFQLSFGNTTSAYKALDRVKRAAMGLVVVLFSTVILYQVNPDLIKLKMATPEGIAPTVCCKIPSKTSPQKLLPLTPISQTVNTDHSVTQKWSNGTYTKYLTYKRSIYDIKFCSIKYSAVNGTPPTSGSDDYRVTSRCPSDIKFPADIPIQTWDVMLPATPATSEEPEYQAGTIRHFTLDPALNTCKYITTTFDTTASLIQHNCPDDTSIPETTITWKQVYDESVAASPAVPSSLPASSVDTPQSSEAFTYYMATEFKGKEYVCNGSDQVEADVNLCFEAGDDVVAKTACKAPSGNKPKSQDNQDYDVLFKKYGTCLPTGWTHLKALAFEESGLQNDIVNCIGMIGLFQTKPNYCKTNLAPYGESASCDNLTDPESNIKAGTVMAMTAIAAFKKNCGDRDTKSLLYFSWLYQLSPRVFDHLTQPTRKEPRPKQYCVFNDQNVEEIKKEIQSYWQWRVDDPTIHEIASDSLGSIPERIGRESVSGSTRFLKFVQHYNGDKFPALTTPSNCPLTRK